MAQLRLILQEPQEPTTTLLSTFLRLKMDGGDARIRRRNTLKEWLALKSIGCCGATWGGFRPTTLHDDEDPQEIIDLGESPAEGRASDPECLGLVPAGSGMNLAAALAAERQFRASSEPEGSSADTVVGTPVRVSLMRLLEESRDGGGAAAEEKVGSDQVCCVCMGRKKGAAFIPCGHTFCRVCSRELWLNRGSCPICNRPILEILDIF